MKWFRSLFAALFALIIACVISVSAYASPNQIDREAAEKLAIDFLTDIDLVNISSPVQVPDFSKYTSVEKFIEYMNIHMKYAVDLDQIIHGSAYGTRYDDYTFEAEAIIFEEVDGGLLITMHIKRVFHYINTDEWGAAEYSV